jgi:hypothetical protein
MDCMVGSLRVRSAIYPVGFMVCLASCGAMSAETAAPAVEHPFCYTREDIQRGRDNATKLDWAREQKDKLVRAAQRWVELTDAQLDALVPLPRRVVERKEFQPNDTPNVMVNPSAEELTNGKPSGWNFYNGTDTGDWGAADQAHEGKSSAYLKITAKPGEAINIALVAGDSRGYSGERAFQALPETRYGVSFWLKGDVASVNVYVQGWKSPRATQNDRIKLDTTIGTITPTAEWKKYVGTFKTNKDTARFAVMFSLWGKEGEVLKTGQSFQVDEVEIKPQATETSEGAEHLNLSREVYDYGGMFHNCPQAYVLTGDSKYARPVARVLARLAQGWPQWPPLGENEDPNTAGPGPGKQGPPWSGYTGRSAAGWPMWADNKILMFGGIAYDLTFDSGEYEKIGQAAGLDAKELIRRDLFEDAARFFLERQESLGNASGYALSAIAICARNAGRPDCVHRVVRLLDLMLTNSFYRDGMWCERTIGYQIQTMNYSRMPEALLGYSDPPGYTDKLDGMRFDKLDLYSRFPFLRRTFRTPMNFLYQDRSTICVNDTSPGEAWSAGELDLTWQRYGDTDLPLAEKNAGGLFRHGIRAETPFLPAREMAASSLMPALGFAALRSGSGAKEGTTVTLSYGAAVSSHSHTDGLNISLFGKGEVLMDDLGYTHTYLRYSWSDTTASHNAVVVDEKLQERIAGGLDFFKADSAPAPRLQVVKASMPKVYAAAGATLYDRLVALLSPDGGPTYVFDVFRVAGGKQHDLMLHASTKQGQTLVCEDVPLAARKGTLAGEAVPYSAGRKQSGSQYTRKDWYSFIDQIQAGKAGARASFRWELGDAAKTGLAATVFPGPGADCEVFTGRAPTIRMANGDANYKDDKAADKFKMPVVCVRRAGEGLKSAFASILEPFAGKPQLDRICGLKLNEACGLAAGIQVAYGRTTDYLLSGDAGAPLAWKREDGFCEGTGKDARKIFVPETIRLDGRFGYVSVAEDGALNTLCLVGGKALEAGKLRVQLNGNYEGRVESAAGDLTGEKDNVLHVSAALPDGDLLGGEKIIIRHDDGSSSAYTISRVQAAGGKAAIYVADERAFLLSKFRVEKVVLDPPTLFTPEPLLLANAGWFNGKWMTIGTQSLQIDKVECLTEKGTWYYGYKITLAAGSNLAGIKAGDEARVHAIRGGDKFEIVGSALLARHDETSWRLHATGPVEIVLPVAGLEIQRGAEWQKIGSGGSAAGTTQAAIALDDLSRSAGQGVALRAAQK